MSDMIDNSNYNDEPVFYCSRCLSLKVKCEDGLDYCDDCGCGDIGESSFEDWERMYVKRYGRKFIEYGRKKGY